MLVVGAISAVVIVYTYLSTNQDLRLKYPKSDILCKTCCPNVQLVILYYK